MSECNEINLGPKMSEELALCVTYHTNERINTTMSIDIYVL